MTKQEGITNNTLPTRTKNDDDGDDVMLDAQGDVVHPAAQHLQVVAPQLDVVTESNNKQEEKKPEQVEEDYYEPIDPAQSGVYKVVDYDANTGKIRWKIDDIRAVKQQKIYSEEFTIANCPWRLLMFPKGNNVSSLSLYLDVPDAKTQGNTSWVRFARFQVSVLNHKDLNKSVSQDAEKRFNYNETDWGFRDFMPLATLMDEKNGFIDKNGTVYIECVVNLSNDAQVINPLHYDSKTETGFVGLKNQGATCYMNSLLQTWFHITYLRKAVYKMPIEDNESPTNSIPLALQRVFYALQTDKSAVDTKELTKSFGWETVDSFLQHDVQELARVLSDNLEKKMDKTPAKGTMKFLFEGVIKNYIKCINVNFESSGKETFYDLQLNVKGCKNVNDSFKQYIEEEILSGENQYQAEGFGRQDAKKGCLFLSFPPVLTLHLKRFEYDVMRDAMYKINERYEFPEQLDLGPFLAEESESYGKDNTYTLFSVLVHSGDVSGGHYYAFIRPYANDVQWYKFDDDKVYKSKPRDAVDDNYGGAEEKKSKFFWKQPSNNIYRKFTNAYMLVYIKTSEIDQILARVEEGDVPDHLRIRVEKEKEEMERKKREKQEAHKYVHIKVVTDEHLKKHVGHDLIVFSTVEEVKLKKAAPITDLKRLMQEKTGVPPERQRYWRWEPRQNKTERPDAPIHEPQEGMPLEKLFTFSHANPDNLNLYMEEVKTDEGATRPVQDDEIFLFIKKYDPEHRTLQFVSTLFARQDNKVHDIVPKLVEICGFDESVNIRIYEEVKMGMIEPVDPRATFKKAQLQHGDILCVQRLASPQEKFDYPTVPDYFKYLQYRVTIRFAKLDEPKNFVATIELLRTMPYAKVAEKLGQQINVDPDHIRFTGLNPYGEVPRSTPFKTSDVKTLKDMITVSTGLTDILFFEILEQPLTEVENKKELLVHLFNEKVEPVQAYKLLIPKESNVQQLLASLKTKANIDQSVEMRLLELQNHKIYKLFADEEPVEPILVNAELRAEVVPDEEKHKEEGKRIIHVQHFCKDNIGIRQFGSPFFLCVSNADTLATVKAKIQAKLGVKEEEFKKYKFAPICGLQKHEYINDEDLVLQALDKVESYKLIATLGMEHKDPTPRTQSRWLDKPIVIKN